MSYIKSGIEYFSSYLHENIEQTTALSVTILMLFNIDITENIGGLILTLFFGLLKGILTIITALISSKLVHELKKNQYNLIKLVKSIYKQIKNVKKNTK